MMRPLLSLTAVGLALACVADTPTDVPLTPPAFAVTGSSVDPGGGMVTKPFKAKFYTEQVGDLVANGCGPGIVINTQTGKGQATHLGRFTTWMVFCFDMNDPPALGTYWFVPGEGGENGRFVAANGDELWITVLDGFVDFFDPDVPPGYQASFDDEFFFIGGTGRFEGASGGGQIHSLVGINGRTDHRWTGTLTVPQGR